MNLSGISNKDQRDFVRKLVGQGWSVEVTRGTHVLLTSPRGSKLHASLTTSSMNYVHQLRGQVNRILREEQSCT